MCRVRCAESCTCPDANNNVEHDTKGQNLESLDCMQVMSLRRGVELALDAARGLAYMHNRKPAPIVHRDLKPANLMISGALTQVRAICVLYFLASRRLQCFSPAFWAAAAAPPSGSEV